MFQPILATKLYIPQPRAGLVQRSQLVMRIEQQRGHAGGLLLVCAPAGFGKTTLLINWLSQTSLPAVWVSLDEADNDFDRFWMYVITALKGLQTGITDEPLEILRGASQEMDAQARIEAGLTVLINQLSEGTDERLLILDDFHLIRSAKIHAALDFLLSRMPEGFNLALSTRSDPPLGLGRLRARGQLVEVRAADLRFSAEEAAQLLQKMAPLSLSGTDLEKIVSKTEGWAAGLQMAGLALQQIVQKKDEDLSEFIRSFSGSHRFILDYLLDEVLLREPPAIQEFLIRTSILERLSAELCQAVSAWQPVVELPQLVQTQDVLEYLERHNLFVTALDGERQWFRYHHLFSELLRNQLRRRYPQLAANLNRQASQWFESHGLGDEAVHYALASGDQEFIIACLEPHAGVGLLQGRVFVVRGWMESLAPRVLIENIPMGINYAWSLYLSGDFQKVTEWLSILREQALLVEEVPKRREIEAELDTLGAMVSVFCGQSTQSLELGLRALQYLAPENIYLRGLINLVLGESYEDLGQINLAEKAYRLAAEDCLKVGNVIPAVGAVFGRSSCLMLQGKLREAMSYCQQVLALFNQVPITVQLDGICYERKLPEITAGQIYAAMGRIYFEWNELDKAQVCFEKCVELYQSHGYLSLTAVGLAGLAKLAYVNGQSQIAFEKMQYALEVAKRFNSLVYLRPYTSIQAGLWLDLGRIDLVQRWMEENKIKEDNDIASSREELKLLARLMMEKGKLKESLAILEKLCVYANVEQLTGFWLELMVLKSRVYILMGEIEKAQACLQQARQMGAPEGYCRLFLSAELPLKGAERAVKNNPAYGVETLSERELEILCLVVGGCSNQEIAEKLCVSINTVKTHLKNIFGKLGVENRTQAAGAARQRGLVEN
jgi:LuxR family maltose regulon positive regulatory protein